MNVVIFPSDEVPQGLSEARARYCIENDLLRFQGDAEAKTEFIVNELRPFLLEYFSREL